jgi:hypothetical protein
MDSQTIYTVLLDSEYVIEGREYPLYGFSYQIMRDDNTGQVEIREHGWPTSVVLWEYDGPQLADLDEVMVKSRIQEVLN